MAETPTKISLWGSRLTRDQTGTVGDSATVLAIARNLAVGPEGLDQAIVALANEAGATYQPEQNPPLPIRRISVQRLEGLGGTKALGKLEYWRNRIPVNLNAPAAYQAQFRTSTYVSWWYNLGESYDENGHPNGPIEYWDYSSTTAPRPKRWKWQRPALRCYVSTKLTGPPFGSTFDYIGKINSGAVTIGNYSIGAHRVRFDGLAQSDFVADGEWNITYAFTIIPTGFVHQEFKGEFAEGGEAIVNLVLSHETANFVTPGFPTHDGGGIG